MAEVAWKDLIFERTAIPIANTWTAVVIPAGARNTLLGVEHTQASFRVADVNTLNPLSQGDYYLASGHYQVEGVCGAAKTIYVSASVITTAIISYTT